jgi:HTH-type transcriptional regulator/antitoxin HipB
MTHQIDSLRDLAAAARGRRLGLGLTQAELAARARVSRQWLNEFEAGKPTAELGLVIRLLDALGLRFFVGEPSGGTGSHPSPDAAVDLDALLDDYGER